MRQQTKTTDCAIAKQSPAKWRESFYGSQNPTEENMDRKRAMH